MPCCPFSSLQKSPKSRSPLCSVHVHFVWQGLTWSAPSLRLVAQRLRSVHDLHALTLAQSLSKEFHQDCG
eukprot:6482231-Amphidinium_carterae.1